MTYMAGAAALTGITVRAVPFLHALANAPAFLIKHVANIDIMGV